MLEYRIEKAKQLKGSRIIGTLDIMRQIKTDLHLLTKEKHQTPERNIKM